MRRPEACNGMNSSIPIGCFVAVEDGTLGMGKLLQLTQSTASVEWFTSISQRDVRDYGINTVYRVYPSTQTRCYVTDERETEWSMGRIMGRCEEQSKTGIEYDVHFPGGEARYVPEEFVFVRCLGPPVDPIESLIARAHETPFFHDKRQRFVDCIVRQRSVAHGLTGLVSASIALYPHQIDVVRRVLEDPVQRYLLADEVGLGKTIEAGIILRQTWLDNPSAGALVLVPPQLQSQWYSELRHKFGLEVSDWAVDESDDSYVTVCSIDRVRFLDPARRYDILVIDEAQRVTPEACRSNAVIWERCRQLAHDAPKLLLLSATPALHNENEFLAMLHLLDPENYRLSDVDAFRKRVEARQPIGELLLLMREGMPRPPLRRCVDTLRLLFAEDTWVQEQAAALQRYCDGNELSASEADLVIRDLRLHICETYRIYRRMLRSARSSLSEGALSLRAKDPSDPSVVEEFGFHERQATISRLLDEWRAIAVQTIAKADNGDNSTLTEMVTDIFMILLQSAGVELRVLRWAIECRLAGEGHVTDYQERLGKDTASKLTMVPLMEDEVPLLGSLAKELSHPQGEEEKIEMLGQLIHRLSIGSAKSVVFTSNTQVGREMAEHLGRMLSPKTIRTHLQDDSRDAMDEGVESFRSSSFPMVLVCDAGGEEGLNLQFVDNLIHFDLPWDPMRLEQRIGRVDRIGRSAEIHSHVFIALGDDEDPADSLQEAWYYILLEGFRVFSESIADLQFFVEKCMVSLRHTALVQGAVGLREELEAIQRSTLVERKLVREQASLDAIEAFDRSDAGFFDELVKYDGQAHDIQQAVEAWAVDALRFRRIDRDIGDAGQHAARLAPHGPPLVQYDYTERTLIPVHWWREMNYQEPEFSSFSRVQASQSPHTPILRIGHSFVDALADYVNWDDRGRVFAMWRYVPEFSKGIDLLCFQLDYVLESDLTYLRESLSSHTWGDEARRALSRRADGWLKPQYRTIYVDGDLQIIENHDMIDLLIRPYLSFENGGSDFNVRRDRQWVLDGIIAPDLWTGLCQDVRKWGEARVREEQGLREYCEYAAQSAVRDLDRRMEQLRCGLIYGRRQVNSEAVSPNTDSVIDAERQTYESLILGIREPMVRLDAVGVIVLSHRNPFVE